MSFYMLKADEQSQYPTGLKTFPQHFDNIKGEFTDPKGDTIKLNSRLRSRIAEIDAIVLRLEKDLQDLSLAYLVEKINNPKLYYFKDFADCLN